MMMPTSNANTCKRVNTKAAYIKQQLTITNLYKNSKQKDKQTEKRVKSVEVKIGSFWNYLHKVGGGGVICPETCTGPNCTFPILSCMQYRCMGHGHIYPLQER